MDTGPETPKWDAIRLDAKDNVATVLRGLTAGTCPQAAGASDLPVLRNDIARGHKFALTDLKAGDIVFKYGAPIGLATRDIAAGEHVHLHNLEGLAGRDARRATRS